MGIKRNTIIIAEVLSTKPSRLQAVSAMQQAGRLLQDNEVRPSTHKPKAGKQGAQGRVRVERARPAIVTAKHILELEGMLADMAIGEILQDERGYAYTIPSRAVRRWVYPAQLVVAVRGFYQYASADYVPTIEGLMAFEDELYHNGVLPRGYVTPDSIVAITGRQLGK